MSTDVERLLASRLESIGDELRSIRQENRDDRKALADQIQNISANGCSKASDHGRIEKIDERLIVLEFARAKGLGIAVVVVALIGVAVTVLTNLIAKHW